MKFAAIETSTEWCSVALSLDGEILAAERRAGNRASEFVLPMLEQLLVRAGVAMDALEAIAFGAGPGSFTGLRIACGVAQGLAVARGIPVIGISTLEALAEECAAPRVIACIDARMGEVYYSALEKTPSAGASAWRDAVPAACLPPARVPRPAGGGWIGCGSGFSVYRSELEAALGDALAGVRANPHPSAVGVARLAQPRLAAGEGVDAALAAPLYLRDKVALTSAERAAK